MQLERDDLPIPVNGPITISPHNRNNFPGLLSDVLLQLDEDHSRGHVSLKLNGFSVLGGDTAGGRAFGLVWTLGERPESRGFGVMFYDTSIEHETPWLTLSFPGDTDAPCDSLHIGDQEWATACWLEKEKASDDGQLLLQYGQGIEILETGRRTIHGFTTDSTSAIIEDSPSLGLFGQDGHVQDVPGDHKSCVGLLLDDGTNIGDVSMGASADIRLTLGSLGIIVRPNEVAFHIRSKREDPTNTWFRLRITDFGQREAECFDRNCKSIGSIHGQGSRSLSFRKTNGQDTLLLGQ